ncbi:MAG: GFA family protein [Paracoccaceae bacterium]
MKTRGSCLCGAVRYEVAVPLTEAHACHCTQCRKQSGHYIACASAPKDAVSIDGADHITWYQATPGIGRGFCRQCGAHLFWDDGGEEWSINAGALKAPTGIKISRHIFCADKGDYYEITDGLPQFYAYPTDHE